MGKISISFKIYNYKINLCNSQYFLNIYYFKKIVIIIKYSVCFVSILAQIPESRSLFKKNKDI